MTDKEFFEHLDWLKTVGDKIGSITVGKDFIPKVLDLINRREAEIERLQLINDSFTDIGKLYSEIKAEAITEFAERLKAIEKVGNTGDGFVYAWEISKVVKEMKGE